MSDETKQNANPQPLQFDTAEAVGSDATATSLACTACSTDIRTSYFEVNGAIVCASCRAKLSAHFTGGSSANRFARAVGLGLAAAAAGSALYYAVLALTGYEIGLVAIVVGFLVGRAVNRGSQGRGGRAYQVLAIGLTYFAIVTTYIPMIIKSAREQAAVQTPADSTAQKSLADRAPAAPSTTSSTTPATELQGSAAQATPATNAETTVKTFGVVQVLIGTVVLLAFAAVVPVLAGMDNIIGMLIIGFALFEAWRQNQRVTLAITGPYKVGAKRDGGESVEGVGG